MAATKAKPYSFRYLVCRNISSPEDDMFGRKVYSGHAPTSTVLALEDNENVREYLVDAEGKQRRSPTLVHQAIRKTLSDSPDQFSILNGGMVIVCDKAEVDEKTKTVTLWEPSIINGSQTQGELQRFFKENDGEPEFEPSIRFEIIVTDDSALIADISIARNFQNDVRPISIAGRRGDLDELESAVQDDIPGIKLRKSETDLSEDFLDTEKLIQATFAVMPEDILKSADANIDASNKVFTYSQKTRCLKLFQRLVDGPNNDEVYKCFLDLAGPAWRLYTHWKANQGFKGTGLKSILRDGREIIEVPDGIIFPIIAAHAAFVRRSKGDWVIRKPSELTDKELIGVAKQAYIEIADHNPQTMGKSRACYSTLLQITSIYARLARTHA